MNENGNEKYSLLLFVARFGLWGVFPFAFRCILLLFVARSCFCLKNQNRQMPLVACFVFSLVRKARTSNERQKKSKWKRGVTETRESLCK